MALPPFLSPTAIIGDLRAFLASRQRHQWVFAALSVGIPMIFAAEFYFQKPVDKLYTPPPVVFVEQWQKTRSVSEIKAQQIKDAPAEREARKEAAEFEAKEQKRLKAIQKALHL